MPRIRKKKFEDRPDGMRLFTHNMLRCNVKGVSEGYPLRIEVIEAEEREEEFNADFVKNIIPKLNWPALVGACATVPLILCHFRQGCVYCMIIAYSLKQNNTEAAASFKVVLPAEIPTDALGDEGFLRLLHHAIMEVGAASNTVDV